MKYLIRHGKVEYSGSKQAVMDYINEAYSDDYFVQEYGKIFKKDFSKFIFCLDNLGLILSDRKPKRRSK
jgi:hypothetical protein